MRYPRKRRPRRTWRWEGVVEEVDGQAFGALLVPVDHVGPDVWAEFDLWRLPGAIPGRVFTMYAHRRGLKRRVVIRERRLPPWTAEEIDDIRERARARAALLDRLAD